MRTFNEIFNLAQFLTDSKIPFECKSQFDGYHLWYPNSIAPKCSVVCFKGTYGYNLGLLEIMGLLTDEEKEFDNVVGYLDAAEVFRRISFDYSKKED